MDIVTTTADDGSPRLEGSDTVVASGDVLVSEVDDEVVMLDRDADAYYGLNRVGAFIWERLDRERTVNELERATADAFDVPVETCRDDVREFLRSLVEADLVERL